MRQYRARQSLDHDASYIVAAFGRAGSAPARPGDPLTDKGRATPRPPLEALLVRLTSATTPDIGRQVHLPPSGG